MAHYKGIDTNPLVLAVDPARQRVPGTFEHALHHLLDHAVTSARCVSTLKGDIAHCGRAVRPDATCTAGSLHVLPINVIGARAHAFTRLRVLAHNERGLFLQPRRFWFTECRRQSGATKG